MYNEDYQQHECSEDNLCPVCLVNDDDDGQSGGLRTGMCTICGQMYCGSCTKLMAGTVTCCPTCRSPPSSSDEERVERLMKLVYDRSPGRHTARTQFSLGDMYLKGKGVPQDYRVAAQYFRIAAERNVLGAQYNLAIMYTRGDGVRKNEAKARKWFLLAAQKGHQNAQKVLQAGTIGVNLAGSSVATKVTPLFCD